VADHDADRPVVDGVVRTEVKERRLEDSRGKDDLVLRRVVIGVHRLGCHLPLRSIDRAAELVDVALVLELVRSFPVSDEVAAIDPEL